MIKERTLEPSNAPITGAKTPRDGQEKWNKLVKEWRLGREVSRHLDPSYFKLSDDGWLDPFGKRERERERDGHISFKRKMIGSR